MTIKERKSFERNSFTESEHDLTTLDEGLAIISEMERGCNVDERLSKFERKLEYKAIKDREKETISKEVTHYVDGPGTGDGYALFCRSCFAEIFSEMKECPRCNNKRLITRDERTDELNLKVEEKKSERAAHIRRKDTWQRRCNPSLKIMNSRESRITDYSRWDNWEPDSDSEDELKPCASDPNFVFLENEFRTTKIDREKRSKRAAEYNEEGKKLYASYNLKDAYDQFQRGIEVMKDYIPLWVSKAACEVTLQNYEEAIKSSDFVLNYHDIMQNENTRVKRLNALALTCRAKAKMFLLDVDGSINDSEEALMIDDKNLETLTILSTSSQMKEEMRASVSSHNDYKILCLVDLIRIAKQSYCGTNQYRERVAPFLAELESWSDSKVTACLMNCTPLWDNVSGVRRQIDCVSCGLHSGSLGTRLMSTITDPLPRVSEVIRRQYHAQDHPFEGLFICFRILQVMCDKSLTMRIVCSPNKSLTDILFELLRNCAEKTYCHSEWWVVPFDADALLEQCLSVLVSLSTGNHGSYPSDLHSLSSIATQMLMRAEIFTEYVIKICSSTINSGERRFRSMCKEDDWSYSTLIRLMTRIGRSFSLWGPSFSFNESHKPSTADSPPRFASEKWDAVCRNLYPIVKNGFYSFFYTRSSTPFFIHMISRFKNNPADVRVFKIREEFQAVISRLHGVHDYLCRPLKLHFRIIVDPVLRVTDLFLIAHNCVMVLSSVQDECLRALELREFIIECTKCIEVILQVLGVTCSNKEVAPNREMKTNVSSYRDEGNRDFCSPGHLNSTQSVFFGKNQEDIIRCLFVVLNSLSVALKFSLKSTDKNANTEKIDDGFNINEKHWVLNCFTSLCEFLRALQVSRDLKALRFVSNEKGEEENNDYDTEFASNKWRGNWKRGIDTLLCFLSISISVISLLQKRYSFLGWNVDNIYASQNHTTKPFIRNKAIPSEEFARILLSILSSSILSLKQNSHPGFDYKESENLIECPSLRFFLSGLQFFNTENCVISSKKMISNTSFLMCALCDSIKRNRPKESIERFIVESGQLEELITGLILIVRQFECMNTAKFLARIASTSSRARDLNKKLGGMDALIRSQQVQEFYASAS